MSFDSFLQSFPPQASAGNRDAFVEAECHSVAAEGMYFTVPSWDDGKHLFGPAPWPMSRVEPAVHDHLETVPAPGARLLVLFLGIGVGAPWVLSWWP